MIEKHNAVSFKEFSENLAAFLDYVARSGEVLVVERSEGDSVVVSPKIPSAVRTKTEADWKAFRSAAGSWDDMDAESFLADVYESRNTSRSPVEL